ncbi:hypothetical protein BDZ45DRAFT_188322 [Acephala macrosclerotiorum]|nr:hypothetical protein BDZ45DRAFT_188322 [Acephala macrosclerotiorum]
MESLSLLSNIKEPAILGHFDLSAQNILVDKVGGLWIISEILDWDDAMSVRGVIGRKPPIWLWQPEIQVEADLAQHVVLTENQRQIKETFDEAFTASIPSFRDDAYRSGQWLRRLGFRLS